MATRHIILERDDILRAFENLNYAFGQEDVHLCNDPSVKIFVLVKDPEACDQYGRLEVDKIVIDRKM